MTPLNIFLVSFLYFCIGLRWSRKFTPNSDGWMPVIHSYFWIISVPIVHFLSWIRDKQ